MLASWLALPPWEGRSSEERPDRLSQCQHTLLVAVNSRSLGKAVLVRSCCCCSPSLPGAGQGTWVTLPMAPSRVVPWGLEEFPWYRRGCQVCPEPAPCQAMSVLCPGALQESHCGHGDQRWQVQELGTWDEGECRKNPSWEKTPTPQNPNKP